IVSAIRILDSHARLAAIASLGGILSLAAFSTGFLAVPLVAAAIALLLRRALRPPALQRLRSPLLPRFATSARAPLGPAFASALRSSSSTPTETRARSRVASSTRPSCAASLTVLRDLGISIVGVNPVEDPNDSNRPLARYSDWRM